MVKKYKNIKILSSDEFIATAIGAIAFIVFLPAIGFDFVNWDDNFFVYENENLAKGFTGYLSYAFTTLIEGNYHPITLISLWIDYKIWGLDPLGYHLTNIIIHSLNAAVLYLVIKKIIYIKFKNNVDLIKIQLTVSTVTALIFAVHPLNIESVVWVSERKEVLFLFFYLLSILTYLNKYTVTNRKSYYIKLSLTFFLISLLSKSMAVSLPIVILIIDYYINGVNKDAIKEKIPFIILAFLFALLTIIIQSDAGAIKGVLYYSLHFKIVNAIVSYVVYIFKIFVPVELTALYPCPKTINYLSFKVISIVTGFIASMYLIYFKFKNKELKALMTFYFLTLLPVIGIIKVGAQCSADRYTYLSGIAIYIIIGIILLKIFENKKKNIAIVSSIVIIVCYLSILNRNQIKHWENTITLWSRGVDVLGSEHPVLHKLLAETYFENEMYEKAVIEFKTALQSVTRKNYYFKTYNDLAISLAYIGNTDEAIKYLKKSLGANPEYGLAAYNLYKIYKNTGDRDASLFYYKIAKSLDVDEIKEAPDLEFEELIK